MRGEGTTAVYRSAAVLVWALAIWHSWLARGMFVDGSAALLYMMHDGGYALFYDSRQTLMAVTQTPAAIAIRLGVTDTHLLAQLLSAGLFGLPAAYYHGCLARARHDPALLGAVILSIAVVFLPTSFFIMGEYNAILPAILFVALVVATTRRPSVGDGVLLIATAAILLRSYEIVLAFGLLAAGMIAWRLRNSGARGAGSVLYGAAALLFVVAAGLSLQSLLGPHPEGRVDDALSGIWLFWTNVQFMLPFGALLTVAIVGLADPRRLESRRLYVMAGVLLLLLALCPVAWLTGGLWRPLPKSHYHTRMMAGLVMAAIVIAVWIYAVRPIWMPRALAVLGRAAHGRRLMLFAFAALVAALPADLQLTELWRRSVAEFQATIAARTGLIPVGETLFSRQPYNEMIENWALASQSLVMRRAIADGIVVPPLDFNRWQFLDARKPWITNVDRFLWDGGR
jgi:hypothetical protein